MARAWAEECYQNMDYCDYWNIDTELKKGTNASGGTSSCEYPWIEGAEAMHVCSFGDPTKGGNAGWHTLDQARSDLGIEVVFNCHDEELIQNPDTKEIVGCYTLIGDDEAPKAVKARKGVVMTLGGFEFNDELKNEYCKCYPMSGFYGWPFNTGDGIKMVQNVGAQLWHMNNIIGSYNAYSKDFEWPYAFTVTPGANNYVMLDRLGKRWIAESTFCQPACGMARIRKVQRLDARRLRAHSTWVIAGQEVIDAGPLGAVKGGVLNTPGGSTAIGMALEDIPSECGGFGRLERRQPNRKSKGLDHQSRHPPEELAREAAVDNAPERRISSSHSKRQRLRRRKRPCIRSNRRHARARLSRRRSTPVPLYPGGCSTLGARKRTPKRTSSIATTSPSRACTPPDASATWPATRTASRAETTPRTWCGAHRRTKRRQASKRGTPKPSRPAPPSPSPCAPAPSLSRGAFRF
ncbi:MAG: FAD-binding protein [Eggerthella lenta]